MFMFRYVLKKRVITEKNFSCYSWKRNIEIRAFPNSYLLSLLANEFQGIYQIIYNSFGIESGEE